jgi:hypothetical protein
MRVYNHGPFRMSSVASSFPRFVVTVAKDEQPAFFQILDAAKMSPEEAGIETLSLQMELSLVSVQGAVWGASR